MTTGPFYAGLDDALPQQAWCGPGTSWFVSGWCFHTDQPIQELELVIGDVATPVLGRAGRRPDVHAALSDVPTDERRPLGFWALVDVVPVGEPSPRPVLLQGTLADGSTVVADLGRTTPVRDDRLSLDLDSAARVAIAMATYEPPDGLFEAQVTSLRAQTFTDWVCVVCDDGSSPAALDRIVVAISGDPRFVLVRNRENVGHYRNFERALRLLPRGPELVSLADQDDIWYPDKLARCVAALERDDAVLVATDCRLVEPGGRLRGRLFDDITPNVDDLRAALITSTLPGASMVFRRSLLDVALPFPPTAGISVHDHWIATVAVSAGRVTALPEATYDWVQHPDNTLGWPEKPSKVLSLAYRVRTLPWALVNGAGSCFEVTIPVAQRARTLALRGSVGGDPARRALLDAIGGPGAGVRRERVRLTALDTAGNDAKVLRGGDRQARIGAAWMASHAVRRRFGIGAHRLHQRLAASTVPRRGQAARPDDRLVSLQADVSALFADGGSPTVAVAAPDRPLPPVELMHRVGAGPEGGSQVDTFHLVGRSSAAGVLAAAPDDLLEPGSSVLDFGCGAGRTLRFLHEARPDLVLEGCDIDARSIEWLERNVAAVAAFENKEIPPLDRPDGSYDLIYVLSVFTHLADTWSAWLAEMHRLLRPGGTLVATFLGPGPYESFTDREYDPDRVGMAVIHLGESWDLGGPVVFHSEWWIREHWGRAFEVVRVHPRWPDLGGPAMQQSAAVMRRRDVAVTPELLEEWRDPARERLGMLDALDLAHDETARWRSHTRELQHAMAQHPRSH